MKRNILLFLLLTCVRTIAQESTDTVRLRYNASVTGTYLHGNINQLRILSAVNAAYRDRKDKLGLQENFTYNYFKDNVILKQTDLVSQTVARYKTGRHFYPIAIIWLQSNRLLDYKGLALGGGMEYAVLDKPGHLFTPGLTLWQEWNDFGSTDFKNNRYDGKNNLNTARLAVRLFGYHTFTVAKLRFSYNIYGMQSLRWSENLRIYANTALELPVYKGFSFKTAYTYSYEEAVITTRKHADHAVTFGISYGNMNSRY